jgi:hypothetical protein
MLDEGSGQDQTLFGENYFLKETNNKTSSDNDRSLFVQKLFEKTYTLGKSRRSGDFSRTIFCHQKIVWQSTHFKTGFEFCQIGIAQLFQDSEIGLSTFL